MAIIYHITNLDDWTAAKASGSYSAPSLKEEGFIHCSEESQVEGVLLRFFKGKENLVKLTLDTDRLTSPLKYDLAPSINQEFPHIYGPLNIDAVIKEEGL
ncbi:MAG: DUF952 domain-containing protein [Candidatus Dadabacteria bacterium]